MKSRNGILILIAIVIAVIFFLRKLGTGTGGTGGTGTGGTGTGKVVAKFKGQEIIAPIAARVGSAASAIGLKVELKFTTRDDKIFDNNGKELSFEGFVGVLDNEKPERVAVNFDKSTHYGLRKNIARVLSSRGILLAETNLKDFVGISR